MGQLLTDKICLVTGAGRGIGKAVVKKFIEEGAIVYANVRHENSMSDLQKELKGTDLEKLREIVFDLTDIKSIKDAVMLIKKECGKIDVLVNNAGVVTNEALGMISIDEMKKMFDVNVFGTMELSQIIATRFMEKQNSGSIINISSMVGVEGCKGQIAYSASKGAIISITKSMAKELSDKNVRVNAVAPGIIETERIKNTIDKIYHGNVPKVGMGKLGCPEDIADACLYLASDMSKYVTGQVLGVHGDITL